VTKVRAGGAGKSSARSREETYCVTLRSGGKRVCHIEGKPIIGNPALNPAWGYSTAANAQVRPFQRRSA